MNQLFRRCGLVLARLALSAWVGAATLFVINGVRLVTEGVFDSTAKDYIALIRFPAYYLTGVICLLLAFVGLMMARRLPEFSPSRWVVVFSLLVLAWGVLWGDYLLVYSRLAEMITPPGTARPPGFHGLHRASEVLNAIQLAVSLAAACACNWPMSHSGASASLVSPQTSEELKLTTETRRH